MASIVSQLFDAVSGLFLNTLGTDMTAMEEYFPFVTKAYSVMQVTAWALLILIVVWQLFRAFGGPITEAENPWHLVVRGAIFALLIGYAKPIFLTCLNIARAPYTSLMEISMTAEDFTFAGVEQALTNGLATLVAAASVVGLILIVILEIALGWNYFKLLLETVERYIVVGVLCYTSPLAFSVGASKATNNVFRSWCRMVGSQLLLLVMNVWFLRGFASSMGHFIGNGGALSNGNGSIFLWMFCALAYLKCAQRFDSYLASIGMNVAQTGSSMAMEMMMAARVVSGAGNAARSAGSVFGRAGGNATATGTGAAANGFAASFASRFNPNSYVRDAVVDGGTRMGFSGGAGVVGRAFGGIAARNGATLNGDSISSVATRMPNASGAIAGDIADRSLGNYMPHMQGFQLQGTQISGGHISTTATTPDGKQASVDLWNASQFEKPEVPHSVITASDGSQWYQMASGDGRGAFYDAPVFHGAAADAAFSAAEDVPNATGPQVSGDSLTYDGMDTQPGVAQFPGGETIPTTADMPDNEALSGDSMVVPPDMGTFPASGEIPQSGGFQHGENGDMSPDANADVEKQQERLVPVSYTTYKSVRVTVITRMEAAGIVNGVPRYNYTTEEKTYYLPDDVRESEVSITVPKYKEVSVTVPVYSNGKITDTRKETYYEADGTEVLDPTTEIIKYVECTISPFDNTVIAEAFGIDMSATYPQFNLTYGEVIQNMANALKMTLYGTLGSGSSVPLTDAELIAFVNSLECNATRKHILTTALSLVGKVPYFWGGKSEAGWNDEWNTPKLVTAAGSSSTGTIRPYGLDCSGFTDWVYKTALGVSIQAGSWAQYTNSTPITASELLPGDLGFLLNASGTTDHVLIFAGYDDAGNRKWVHSEGGIGVHMSTPRYDGELVFRRPNGVDFSQDVGSSAYGDPLYELEVDVTHYCACTRCCGPNAQGITASGKRVATGMVAMSSYYPFGTQIMINGVMYTVEDRGGSGIENSRNRVDIYVADHNEALRLGRFKTTAYIYRIGR